MLRFVLLVGPDSDDHMVVIKVWSPGHKIFAGDRGGPGHNDRVLTLMSEVVLGDNVQSGRRQESDGRLMLGLILGLGVAIEHIAGSVEYWHLGGTIGEKWFTVN